MHILTVYVLIYVFQFVKQQQKIILLFKNVQMIKRIKLNFLIYIYVFILIKKSNIF